MERLLSSKSANVRKISHLFIECSYLEQMELLDKLSSLIVRDFIGDVPLLALVAILKHLSVIDVLKCMGVCKKWFNVIKQCESYWSWLCVISGAAETRCNSAYSTALLLQRHIQKICQSLSSCNLSSGIIHTKLNVLNNSMYSFIDCYGNQITIAARSGLVHMNTSTDSHQLFINETSFIHYHLSNNKSSYKGIIRVVWAATTSPNGSVIFTTNEADWMKIDSLTNEMNCWTDTEIVGSVDKLACCGHCELIIQTKPQPSSKAPIAWMMSVIRLDPQASFCQRSALSVCFKGINALKNDYISIQSIAFLSKSCINSYRNRQPVNCCGHHYILALIGESILIFSYRDFTHYGTSQIVFDQSNIITCTPKLVSIFQLSNEQSYIESLKSIVTLGSNFRVSHDDMLVGVISSGMLSVWSLLLHRVISTTDLCHIYNITIEKCRNFNFLAIGNMYSIVQLMRDYDEDVADDDGDIVSSGTVVVISTLYGHVICDVALADDHRLTGPTEHEWLSCPATFNGNILFPHQNSLLLTECKLVK